mmetsp:Transcript_41681/g.67622  ORF Transcript_41681/g.67622 Transcript_41681/m.67622 type:complete len:1327 (-) Transcript_41681:170-4150(-)
MRQIRGAPVVGAAGGASAMDSLPRTDISNMITAELLKEFGEKDWKSRAKAIEDFLGILTSASNRIAPTGLGDLVAKLKAVNKDSNTNLSQKAMLATGQFAYALGAGASLPAKTLLPVILSNLADNKKTVRDAALAAMDKFVEALTFTAVLDYVPKYMTVEASVGRAALLQWLSKFFNSNEKFDLQPLVKPLIMCLQDKTVDVRAAAEALLPFFVRAVGFEAVRKETKDLPQAARLALDPILEKHRNDHLLLAPAVSSSKTEPMQSVPAAAAAFIEPLPSLEEPTLPAPLPNGSARLTKTSSGALRASTVGSLPRKSVSVSGGNASVRSSSTAVSPAVPAAEAPIRGNNEKERRNNRKIGVKAAFEEPRPDTVDNLRESLLPYTSDFMQSLLFGKDHQKHAGAVAELMRSLPAFQKEMVDNLDLVLKWASVRICEGNTAVVLKVTEFIIKLFQLLVDDGYQLQDYEANNLLPYIIEKMGEGKAGVPGNIKAILQLVLRMYAGSKLFKFIAEGIRSKNFKTRKECLDEMSNLVDRCGLETVCVPGQVLPEVGRCVGEKDKDVRNSALNLLYKVYCIYGVDMWRLIPKIPDKDRTLLEERIRRNDEQREKTGSGKMSAVGGGGGVKPLLLPLSLPLSASMDANGFDGSVTDSMILPDSSAIAAETRQTSPRTPKLVHRTGSSSTVTTPRSLVAAAALRASATPAVVPLNKPPPTSITATASNLPLRSAAEFSLDSMLSQQIASSPISVPQSSDMSSVDSPPGPSFLTRGSRSNSRPNLSAMLPSRSPPPANRLDMSQSSGASSSAADLMRMLESSDEMQRIEGLKTVCVQLADPDPDVPLALVSVADRLLGELTSLCRAAFLPANPEIRLCKYVLNTLMQVFQRRVLVAGVKQASLTHLVFELLDRILDDRLPTVEDGQTILRAMNLLMLKILENSDRTLVFAVLLHVLQWCCCPDTTPSPSVSPSPPPSAAYLTKFTELVIKCLLKCIKQMSTTISELNVDRLLLDLHLFLTSTASINIPPGADGTLHDMPLRTAKTILSELVKLKGPSIKENLRLLPTYPQPEVVKWIDSFLISGPMPAPPPRGTSPMRSSMQLNLSQPLPPSVAPPLATILSPSAPTSNPISARLPSPTPPAAPSDDSDSSGIATIFKRIGTKETSWPAVVELFRFIEQHGDGDVEREMMKYGPAFQAYVRRNLDKARDMHGSTSTAPDPVLRSSSSNFRVSPTPTGNNTLSAPSSASPSISPPALNGQYNTSNSLPPTFPPTGAALFPPDDAIRPAPDRRVSAVDVNDYGSQQDALAANTHGGVEKMVHGLPSLRQRMAQRQKPT